MTRKKIHSFVSIILILLPIFIGSVFIGNTQKVDAVNLKTVTITFATTPTYATASKATLKYNKDFAFSYSFDDGLIAGYEPAFKYMNGGYSTYLGQYFPGLYFTDGAGNNVPFRGGYAFYTRNPSYSDIHVNTPSYINWTQLQEVVDYGWDIFNHGYTSATVPVSDPNHVYYVGDPGGHVQGALDYAYELNRANVDLGNHINLKNNAGATTVPFQTSEVILPNGDANYIQPAFNNNFKAVYAQQSDYTFDGSTVTAPDYTNVNNPISSNRHVMQRWFDYETRYISGGPLPGQLFNRVDQLAANSTGATKYWGQEFTHQITTSTYSGDWNGGITWTTWKSLMDHIENSYGRFGNDKAWVAGAEEVYDYMMVKQNTTLVQNLVGNQLTIEIDSSNIPTGLRHYALSLLINSDATISSISYGSDIVSHSDNKTTGLVNVDWGVNTYPKNDITRVEGLVSTAESNRTVASISNAQTYVDLLSNSQQLTKKNAFNVRLGAIVVPLRTWYVNVRGDFISAATVNTYLSTFATHSPSIHNWNNYGIVKDSTINPVGNDLVNLKDADGLISTISLTNTAPFKYGSLTSASTGNNSGLYPDSVISNGAQVYAASTTPAKIKIYGLNNSKNYNIKLFGYTSNTGQSGNGAITQYTIGGVTKELIVKSNISQYSEFTSIIPNASGEIEITISPKQAAWGYGMLNAMEIIENLLPAPSSLSYSSPHVYTKNSTITSLTPTVSGLEITYSITPTLPAGLSFNTSTGVISGTPTAVKELSTYTVTATNTGGSTSFGVVLTVNDIAPTSLSYTTPNIYINGSAISLLSPSSSGGIPVYYFVSPSLPSGLSLDSSTGVISGIPTASSGASTYTVTASNTGGDTTFNISIRVNDVAPNSLSYISPNTYTRGTTITSLSPTVIGSPTSYSISPDLPTGILLNTLTGVISGTPTGVAGLATYTVTATNTGGSTTFDITITVNDIPIITPVATPSAGIYNITQSVTLSSSGSDYIKYSTIEVPATCSAGTLYSGAISVSVSETIYVRACNNIGNSSTATFTYTIDSDAPATTVADPTSGTYNSTQSVTLSSSGSDYIKYSTTTTPATCSAGTLYSGAISVSVSETIYVRACDNAGNSSTTSFAYTIFKNNNNNTPPTIRYSTTSFPADCSSDLLYNDSVSFSSSRIVYLRICDNSGNSTTASFNYVAPKKNIGSSSVYHETSYIQNSNPVITPTSSTSNTLVTLPAPMISEIQELVKDLKFGIKDKDVKTLQLFLIKQNKGPSAKKLSLNGATNYFGKLTQSALAEWQKANGVKPSSGYFGLITRAKIKFLNL